MVNDVAGRPTDRFLRAVSPVRSLNAVGIRPISHGKARFRFYQYYIILYYITLYDIILFYNALYHIVLYYIISYYCIVFYSILFYYLFQRRHDYGPAFGGPPPRGRL